MLRRFLLLALLTLFLAPAAEAQFSRIMNVTARNNNNTNAAFYSSPFVIKAGTNCTWSISGIVATFNCSGGVAGSVPFSGVTTATNIGQTLTCGNGCVITTSGTGSILATNSAAPGGSNGEMQYRVNATTFGGVTGLTNGLAANCGGSATACQLLFTQGAADYAWVLTGAGAPANSYVSGYMFSDAGFYLTAFNSMTMLNAELAVVPTGNYLSNGTTGFTINPPLKQNAFNRYLITTPVGENPVIGDMALSAGWGTTASVTQVEGSDNNPRIFITSSGTGQGANPTIAFTFHNGIFGNTAQTWAGNCTVTAGTGAISPITYSASTTVLTLTYNATPVAAATYVVSCYGAVAGAN